jgi:hypothetical protein
MKSKITFFPVDNGDMTLIELENSKTILIDINIRGRADDDDDDAPDVVTMLQQRLLRDAQGRLYVDVFLLSHPDQDHCRGLNKHFHLGKPDDCPDDKILISEIWSSPMVFRRASRHLTLSDDAKAFNTEAKRRVNLFKQTRHIGGVGDRILILGEDENGKTDNLDPILVQLDKQIHHVNGAPEAAVHARLLGPLSPSEFQGDEEETLSKNNSSVIVHFLIASDGNGDACAFLTGGDAEVAIWEKLWEKYGEHPWLQYDILQTPHHCSWHSLSYESWGDTDGKAKVSVAARNALDQANTGAFIIASSKPIEDDDNDPPCIGAKREYAKIARRVGGSFVCTGDLPQGQKAQPLSLELNKDGPSLVRQSPPSPKNIFIGAVGRQPLSHG